MIRVGNGDGRVTGRGCEGHSPGTYAGMSAAIDDEALSTDRHLEAADSGMGGPIQLRRRRCAAIDDHDRASDRQAIESCIRGPLERPAARVGLRQDRVEQQRLAFLATVEQRQPAIAVSEEAQRRRHAIDGVLDDFRHGDPRRLVQGANIDEHAEHRSMHGRAPLHVKPVR